MEMKEKYRLKTKYNKVEPLILIDNINNNVNTEK